MSSSLDKFSGMFDPALPVQKYLYRQKWSTIRFSNHNFSGPHTGSQPRMMVTESPDQGFKLFQKTLGLRCNGVRAALLSPTRQLEQHRERQESDGDPRHEVCAEPKVINQHAID